MQSYFEKKLSPLHPTEITVRIEETLKFLNMAVYCHGAIPVSKEIDEIWHLWILETREYQKLCSSLQGRTFLHHTSNAYLAQCEETGESREDELLHGVTMLGSYVLNYGPFEKGRVQYWLLADRLVNQCGWSIDQLNDWLIDRPEYTESNLAN
jgi:hypothetical protein